MTAERRELLDFALELAAVGEAQIMPRYRRASAARKADGEVTEADRNAEAAMRAPVAERHPQHAVLGEEFGTSAATPALAPLGDRPARRYRVVFARHAAVRYADRAARRRRAAARCRAHAGARRNDLRRARPRLLVQRPAATRRNACA